MKAAAAMAAAANDNPLADAPETGVSEGVVGTIGTEVLPGAEGRPAEADGTYWRVETTIGWGIAEAVPLG